MWGDEDEYGCPGGDGGADKGCWTAAQPVGERGQGGQSPSDDAEAGGWRAAAVVLVELFEQLVEFSA